MRYPACMIGGDDTGSDLGTAEGAVAGNRVFGSPMLVRRLKVQRDPIFCVHLMSLRVAKIELLWVGAAIRCLRCDPLVV